MPRNNYIGTVTLNLPDAEGNNPPRHGDHISFTVTSDAPGPFVHLQVTQNGSLVCEGWAGGNNPSFGLDSRSYSGGAATGTALLVYSTKVGPHGPVWSDPLDTEQFEIDA